MLDRQRALFVAASIFAAFVAFVGALRIFGGEDRRSDDDEQRVARATQGREARASSGAFVGAGR